MGDGPGASEFREVTCTKASQAARVGLQKPDWQLEALLFHTEIDGENGKLEQDPAADRRDDSALFVRYYSSILVPRQARLTSTTARVNLSLFPLGDLTGYSDLAITQTRYKENAIRRDTRSGSESPDSGTLTAQESGGIVTSKIQQFSYASRLGARMDVGKWLALGAHVSLEHLETKGAFALNSNTPSETIKDKILTYMAMMELLL